MSSKRTELIDFNATDFVKVPLVLSMGSVKMSPLSNVRSSLRIDSLRLEEEISVGTLLDVHSVSSAWFGSLLNDFSRGVCCSGNCSRVETDVVVVLQVVCVEAIIRWVIF